MDSPGDDPVEQRCSALTSPVKCSPRVPGDLLEYVYHAGRLAVERGTAGPRSERTSEARDCTNSPGLRFALRVEGQGKTPFPEFSTREAV